MSDNEFRRLIRPQLLLSRLAGVTRPAVRAATRRTSNRLAKKFSCLVTSPRCRSQNIVGAGHTTSQKPLQPLWARRTSPSSRTQPTTTMCSSPATPARRCAWDRKSLRSSPAAPVAGCPQISTDRPLSSWRIRSMGVTPTCSQRRMPRAVQGFSARLRHLPVSASDSDKCQWRCCTTHCRS